MDIEPCREGYRAESPEMPGCTATGRTPEEALAALRLARADQIRASRHQRKARPADRVKEGPEEEPSRRLGLEPHRLEEFCRRWSIDRFWLFGSVLRGDFGPTSDVDILVRFQDQATWSLLDLGDMAEELESWFGRPVDLVQEGSLTNPIRRAHILEHRKLVYAADE